MAKPPRVLRSSEGVYGGTQLQFFCPGCQRIHSIQVGEGPGARWEFDGNYSAPTFSPSVLVRTGHYVDGTSSASCSLCARAAARGRPSYCGICHSFVRAGRIQFLDDCTHALAGQTVGLPEIDDAPIG